jgi:putative membrane protein
VSEPVDPRVILAAERTFLAWVRTALALLGFGIVVAKFDLFVLDRGVTWEGRAESLGSGVTLVTFGIVILIVSAIHYRRYVKTYSAGLPVSPPGRSLG